METLIWFHLILTIGVSVVLLYFYPMALSRRIKNYEEMISRMYVMLLGIVLSFYLIYVPYVPTWNILDNSTVVSGVMPMRETATFGYITFFFQLVLASFYTLYYIIKKPIDDYTSQVEKDLNKGEKDLRRGLNG